ncbi:hypothetical protein LK994_06460 [Ferruginibacter lapsinanis]|uniref:hypothetical protein n=1 Tax=Ferruginibacter lapsinanis TaxID=563172 RepID=UPI001E56CE85|nr:hypothetical protein [Ferruginibacter lapsinanis]UEG51114.1 hypothetical protein LK994_06460 [Ferruginibacter lapsinanis]
MKQFKDKWVPLIIMAILVSLIIWGIDLYRQTFINWKILGALTLIIPLIILPITLKVFNSTKESTIEISVMNFIYLSPITYFSILALNYYISAGTTQTTTLAILKKSAMYNRSKNNKPQSIRVSYKNLNKQLVFANSEKVNIRLADSIEIVTIKGILGYEIVDSYSFK